MIRTIEYLAADRQRELLAEARRERLVRSLRQPVLVEDVRQPAPTLLARIGRTIGRHPSPADA
jgi:hypothetical protein